MVHGINGGGNPSEHTRTPRTKTTGNIGQGRFPKIEQNSWEQRVNPYEMPRTVKKGTCNGASNTMYTNTFANNVEVGMSALDSMATLVDRMTGKVKVANKANALTKFFGAFTNTNTKYPQAVDMKKVDPKAAETMTKTVQGLMKTNQPTEVGDAETFANNLIYSMNPKGDGKTVTVDQAMNYISSLDADYKTERGHKLLESMLGELKDTDGNISCDKLKKAFMSAVKNGKTDTESFANALANAGFEKSVVGKDGKAYILQLTSTGIKAYLDDNGKIGQEVPFNQDNFLE